MNVLGHSIAATPVGFQNFFLSRYFAKETSPSMIGTSQNNPKELISKT